MPEKSLQELKEEVKQLKKEKSLLAKQLLAAEKSAKKKFVGPSKTVQH